MFNRNLVTSGFDTETVVSEKYLAYVLLAQVEAGLLPLEFSFETNIHVVVHPPEDYERHDYESMVKQPDGDSRSFKVELLPDDASPIASVAFSPDGSHVATGSWDNLVRFWGVSSGLNEDPLKETLSNHFGSVSGVAYSRDGTRIATSSTDHTIRLFNAETGEQLRILSGHFGPVFGVAFNAAGTRLASAGTDRTVRLWDTATGAEVGVLNGHTGPVFCVAFSPDDARVASASFDRTLRQWDAVSGTELMVFTGHSKPVTSLAFSPDGTRIVSGSEDRSVRLWETATGKELRKLTGHDGAVTSVAYRVGGTRIASGSTDRTVRIWSTNSGNELNRLTGHHAPVLSVAFSPTGTTIASGSEDKTVRLWNTVDGNLVRMFTIPFMVIHLRFTATDNSFEPPKSHVGDLKLIINFDLSWATRSNGLETRHEFLLSLARLHPKTVKLLEELKELGVDVDPEAVRAGIAAQLDRTLPLQLAGGAAVQQIRMKKFATRSVGFYVDLVLRNGPEPESFRERRGNVLLAQDFRSDELELAFATSPGLFGLLGPDARFRLAEETEEGSGNYHFPLHDNPFDRGTPIKGKIKDIRVRPLMVQSGHLPPQPANKIVFDVHVEIKWEDMIDPDVSLNLILIPKRDVDGFVEWDLDVDVDFHLMLTVFSFGIGILLALMYANPFVGWGSALMIGTIVGLGVTKGIIAEPLAAQAIHRSLDQDAVASFLDPIPFRVPASHRRWDPFYLTLHEVIAKVDEVVVDERGIAFEGHSLHLAKQPRPEDHVVIQDEGRSAVGAVTDLRYRVRDFAQFDFKADGPGRDRMAFQRHDPDAEPRLVTLTISQVDERLERTRLRKLIRYRAERIFVAAHEIDGLLCLSVTEREEQSHEVIDAFKEKIRNENRDQVREEVIVVLEQELGRPPTGEEINEEVDKRLDALIEEELPKFKEDEFPEKLDEAIAKVLRFDLAPEELAALQAASVLVLDDKEIITRHNADGSKTTYYRDHPDADPKDNLLSLRHYTPPYEAPQ